MPGSLLLRSGWPTKADVPPTRIDLFFKPVDAVKLQVSYAGLVVRCTTGQERVRTIHESGLGAGASRAFVIESGMSLDYVVSGAVGWQEDNQAATVPSAMALSPPTHTG